MPSTRKMTIEKTQVTLTSGSTSPTTKTTKCTSPGTTSTKATTTKKTLSRRTTRSSSAKAAPGALPTPEQSQELLGSRPPASQENVEAVSGTAPPPKAPQAPRRPSISFDDLPPVSQMVSTGSQDGKLVQNEQERTTTSNAALQEGATQRPATLSRPRSSGRAPTSLAADNVQSPASKKRKATEDGKQDAANTSATKKQKAAWAADNSAFPVADLTSVFRKIRESTGSSVVASTTKPLSAGVGAAQPRTPTTPESEPRPRQRRRAPKPDKLEITPSPEPRPAPMDGVKLYIQMLTSGEGLGSPSTPAPAPAANATANAAADVDVPRALSLIHI